MHGSSLSVKHSRVSVAWFEVASVVGAFVVAAVVFVVAAVTNDVVSVVDVVVSVVVV